MDLVNEKNKKMPYRMTKFELKQTIGDCFMQDAKEQGPIWFKNKARPVSDRLMSTSFSISVTRKNKF
jgi:hypothetical protein